MPPFEKPDFEYDYDADAQIRALHRYEATKVGRDIPDKAPDRLLLATWNIANLGHREQQRRDDDHRLIAELLSWFDLVAVQEVNDSLTGLRAVQRYLPREYRLLFSAPACGRGRQPWARRRSRTRAAAASACSLSTRAGPVRAGRALL